MNFFYLNCAVPGFRPPHSCIRQGGRCFLRVTRWTDTVAAFADDYPTQKLIQKWIDGEVEHMAWEAQYLYHIEKLGYDNFLIAMM